jgi:mannosyltransferase
VLAAHAVTVLLARHGRRALAHWLAAAAAGAVLVTPLLAISIRQHGAVSWIPRPDLRDVQHLYHDYFGATLPSALLLTGCAVVAVLPPDGWWRRRSGRIRSRPAGSTRSGPAAQASAAARAGSAAQASPGASPAWQGRGGVSLPSVALPMLLVPAALLLLESRVGPSLYQDRYVLYGEAGAALLAGGGLYRLGQWLAAAGADAS